MVRMNPLQRLARGLLVAVVAATGLATQAAESPTAAEKSAPPPVVNSALDADLFYQILLADLKVEEGNPGAAYSMMLEAARKTNDAGLYRSAVRIALQSRSGESALQAARAWRRADPQSREANETLLQILVALNRVSDSAGPLKTELALTPADKRIAVILALPRLYARASDRKQAQAVVEKALGAELNQPDAGPAAWTTIGRMRLAAGDDAGALDAARRGLALDPKAEGPGLLALELVAAKVPQAETIVQQVLAGDAAPAVRFAYARMLIDDQRDHEADLQLHTLTTTHPDYANGWLLLGALQAQNNQNSEADKSVRRFIDMAEAEKPGAGVKRGLQQAYLLLSQIAEKRKDYTQAIALLDRIQEPTDPVAVVAQRASILAKQGKLEAGLKLIQGISPSSAGEARARLLAQVQLLRDNQQYQRAYDLLASASGADPDLLYDQAMIAEKLGKPDDMERLLRRLISLQPDNAQAYNALGYSLADRDERLPEAKQLIQKALQLAPGDAYITDSLGWVEYRMGNNEEAARLLETAYKIRPDVEIAAHLGEVLWTLGQRDRAISVWKQGQKTDADNQTLRDTLQRLHVKL
ncbi:MAG: TPR domain-containing protein [Burkholderiaceae bacterium]|jgi:predicted Zn-dependent protease|nr:MAG: TPR domain-containing protein [Burkholderiaceae bacterium]